MNEIKGFFNEHRYLCNFYTEAPFYLDDHYWRTTEHYYQANKATNVEDYDYVRTALTPGAAKRRGQAILCREDWPQVKKQIMYNCVLAKFSQNEDIREKLLATDGMHLEEANHWGDKIWGTCNGVGSNWLGITLMGVRDVIKMEQFFS